MLSGTARAHPDDPIGQADVISTIGLARVADEAGDARLTAWLAQADRRDLVAVAVRASPFAYAPELLVPALARLVCGRDPVLAPETANAMLQIAERLTPSSVAAREAAVADFKRAREALACARGSEPVVRPDLAKAALVLESALAQLAP